MCDGPPLRNRKIARLARGANWAARAEPLVTDAVDAPGELTGSEPANVELEPSIPASPSIPKPAHVCPSIGGGSKSPAWQKDLRHQSTYSASLEASSTCAYSSHRDRPEVPGLLRNSVDNSSSSRSGSRAKSSW